MQPHFDANVSPSPQPYAHQANAASPTMTPATAAAATSPAAVVSVSPSSAAAAAVSNQSSKGPLASVSHISFLAMCGLFERIADAKATRTQQLSFLEKLWKDMRGATPHDYFQVLRLLMPQLDTQRSVYGLKESKIARFYVELLGLSDTSPDAMRFKHWKDPSRSSVETTVFSDAVFVMLTKRGFSSVPTGGGARTYGTGTRPPQYQQQRQNNPNDNSGRSATPATSSHPSAAAAASTTAAGGQSVPTFMSVLDVNNALDALAAAPHQHEKKAIMFELLRSLCAVEHKWLIRIIMKEMKMRLSQNPILGAFHPHALELFNSTNDLEHVCEQCLDPKALEALAKAHADGNKVFLMKPFKPMLASVVASDKLAMLLQGEKLMVEPKYDGERILLHFDACGGGGGAGGGNGLVAPPPSPQQQQQFPPTNPHSAKILYWSRNAKNSTHLYAPKFDPVIKGCINWAYGEPWRRGDGGAPAAATSPSPQYWPGMLPVYNCVLDGELLLYDKQNKKFVDFGHNRTFAKGGGEFGGGQAVPRGGATSSTSLTSPSLFGGMVIRTEGDDDDDAEAFDNTRRGGGGGMPMAPAVFDSSRYCFQCQIFDIVFLNGECLCATPLERRREILKGIIKEKRDEVHLVPFTYAKNAKEILSALDRALQHRHEGIMLKMAGSHYVPAERKLKWMKLKPDNIYGMADTMDLIVLGAYYGTKYGNRHLSHFLLGAYVDDDDGGAGGSFNNNNNTNKNSSTNPNAASAAAVVSVKREGQEQGANANPSTSTTATTTANAVKGRPNFADKKARFHTVCKVGTGYTMEELRELNSALEGRWISLPAGSPAPPWLDGWRPAAGEAPDVYIHPRDSVVMEINGFSITETVKFKFGYTVRFPRCHRIRHDKDVEDATTTSELHAIVAASVNNVNLNNTNNASSDGADTDSGVMRMLGLGPVGANILTSRKGGDMDELITMRDMKKKNRKLTGGATADDNAIRAKKNMKGEGDFYGSSGGEGAPRKTLVFATRTILAPQQGSVERLSDLFNGYEMCVLQSNIEVMERLALEKLLMSHGAQIVSNPQPNTSVLLATSRSHVKVQNWIAACAPVVVKTANNTSSSASSSSAAKANHQQQQQAAVHVTSVTKPSEFASRYVSTDIVHVSWALDCIAKGQLQPLVPSNVIYASPSLQAKFRLMLDAYHDAYYRNIASVDELKAAMGRVVRSGHHMRVLSQVAITQQQQQQASSAGGAFVVHEIDDAAVVHHNHHGGTTASPPLPLPPPSSASTQPFVCVPPLLARVCDRSRRIAALKRMVREEFPFKEEARDGEEEVIVEGGGCGEEEDSAAAAARRKRRRRLSPTTYVRRPVPAAAMTDNDTANNIADADDDAEDTARNKAIVDALAPFKAAAVGMRPAPILRGGGEGNHRSLRAPPPSTAVDAIVYASNATPCALFDASSASPSAPINDTAAACYLVAVQPRPLAVMLEAIRKGVADIV